MLLREIEMKAVWASIAAGTEVSIRDILHIMLSRSTKWASETISAVRLLNDAYNNKLITILRYYGAIMCRIIL